MGRGGQDAIVGEKHEPLLVRCVVVPDSAELRGVILLRVEVFGHDDLVGLNPGRFVYLLGIDASEPEVAFCPGDKERSRFVDSVKTGEIEISPVHDIEGTGFYADLVEDVHIVNFSVSDDDYGRNAPPEIEKRVELDRPFVFSEFRPGKESQTEVDGGRIQRIDGVSQVYSEGVVDIELPSSCDEDLREIFVHMPIPDLIGVGQRIPGHLPTYPHVVKLRFGRPKTGLDIPEAFSVRQLGKGHGKVLVPAGKALDLVGATTTFDALMKFVCGQKIHELSKDGLS